MKYIHGGMNSVADTLSRLCAPTTEPIHTVFDKPCKESHFLGHQARKGYS